MVIDLLRIYLLAGLIGHKLVWEFLKRPRANVDPAIRPPLSPRVALIKAVKLAILAAILVQTCAPEVLPIAADPRPLRIVGVVIFSIGLFTAILARIQLGRNWSDIEIGRVREDHALVCTGVYRYIRHPIYAGDILLLLGLELALNSWLVLGVLPVAAVAFRKAVHEERGLLQSVPGYDLYCARSKRFIPYVI